VIFVPLIVIALGVVLRELVTLPAEHAYDADACTGPATTIEPPFGVGIVTPSTDTSAAAPGATAPVVVGADVKENV
jgi:hypothetical protein